MGIEYLPLLPPCLPEVLSRRSLCSEVLDEFQQLLNRAKALKIYAADFGTDETSYRFNFNVLVAHNKFPKVLPRLVFALL
ncbi:hypothetical protein N0Y54_41525 [Nostoc punctiforme UO1]|uniref:hypothetical protein n=1 Tax=Nostoc punctiforme TaxID=272131 RepID=UPI0030AF3FD0